VPPLGSIEINRAPVLTLWAAIVAECLGHDPACALTLGKAVAGLNAQSKGQRLGLFKPGETSTSDSDIVELCGRHVPILRTKDGVRAASKGKPLDPAAVEKALVAKFGDSLEEVRAVLHDLARAYPPRDLSVRAFAIYEQFRPEIPAGTGGWGAKGTLDLRRIRALATRARSA
jgi:hypothetical protein